MNCNLDDTIKSVTGKGNYMEGLSKVTGQIMSINMDMYIAAIDKITGYTLAALSCLCSVQNASEQLDEVISTLESESEKLDLKNSAIVKTKKGKLHVGIRPKNIFKSDWFNCIKNIESTINKFYSVVFESYSETGRYSFEDYNKIITDDPKIPSMYKLYSMEIRDKLTYSYIALARENTRKIINIILEPMYDIKGTIDRNWHIVSKAFKKDHGLGTEENIKDMLLKFMLAKYKVSITGCVDHYMSLLLDVVGDGNIVDVDGARFLEIMDSIDLDSLDKKDNVYNFASNAKDIIQSILTNKKITPDLLDKYKEMFATQVVEEDDDNGDGDGDENSPPDILNL